MNQTQDSYQGALVGAAVGDALGVTVNEMTRQQVKERFGVHREFVGGGRMNLAPGQAGAATTLALVVAQSLAEKGETDVKDVVKRLLDTFSSEHIQQAVGPTTRGVLSALKPKARDLFGSSRKFWEQNASMAAGSGCIPRVTSVGMLRRVLFKELVVDTIQVCRLTHYDPRAVDAAIAYNFGVSYLTSGKDPSKLLFKAWRFLSDVRSNKDYRELVGEVEPKEDMVKALKAINHLSYDDLKPSGQAIDIVQAAFWLVLNAIDFEEGVVRAVNLGGDAATLGFVAGALLGARFGEHAIPERWLESLQPRTELEMVADRLCKLGEPKK